MLVLDREQTDTPPGVVLQFEGVRLQMASSGQVFALSRGRTTIGSSPRCNVRIQEPGVQPLHCLILQLGEGSTQSFTARHWAGDTNLNGRRLEESPLNVGDRLQIGPVELAVIGPDNQHTLDIEPSVIAQPSSSAEFRRECVARDIEDIRRGRAGRDVARTRSRKLLAALRQERAAHREAVGESERLAWTTGELEARIAAFSGQLNAADCARQTLAEREAALLADVERAKSEQARLKHRNDELSTQTAELLDEREALRRRVDELQAEQQLLDGKKAQLEREGQSLTEEAAAIHSELEQTQADNTRLQQLSDDRQAAMDALSRDREALRSRACDLQTSLETLLTEKSELERARGEASAQCDALRQQKDGLQAELDAANAAKDATATEVAALTQECDRLRSGSRSVSELEQQVRDAVAEREYTSSELYRALLQLAEMKERDDHSQALAAANQALQAELEKSHRDVVQLTGQVEQLTTLHSAAAETERELSECRVEVVDAQDRLAKEKCELEETVAELRGQLLEACEREASYVAQIESADEWRQKFETAAQHEIALAAQVAELQSILDTREQTAVAATKSAAESEQRVAEYERQLIAANERHAQLEQQLASALEAQQTCESTSNQWESCYTQWEQQQAELHQQIAQLEARLSHALAARPSASSEATEAIRPGGDLDFGVATTELAVNTFDLPMTMAPAVENYSWEPAASPQGAASEPQDDAFGCGVADWDTSPDSSDSDRGHTSWTAATPFAAPLECPAEAPSAASNLAAALFEGVASTDTASASEREVKDQPTSFIERYSHMFTDEAAPDNELSAPLTGRMQIADDHRQPTHSHVMMREPANSISSSDDNEESIEQYMTKLLQRVRGDSQPALAAGRQLSATTSPAFSGPLGYEPSTLHVGSTPLSALGMRDSLMPTGEKAASLTQTAPSRKPSIPMPQTDLEALRALANESARRAISRHALRKYRRNVLTKVIVSVLAAMTSVWLVLQAPAWTDWQFIGGCFAMVIAAIWAGETFRMLFESFRVAASDETDEEIKEISAELQARLPIDVVNKE